MASGKKNYFRHSFSARNNVKIQSLIDKFGLAGYFYWFALIELCAELSTDGVKTEYIYHQRTLIKELRLNKNRLNLVLTYMQSISLLSLTYTENKYALRLPNLQKYMGYYENKIEKSLPNKIKVNETKINESKINDPAQLSFSKKDEYKYLGVLSHNKLAHDAMEYLNQVTEKKYKTKSQHTDEMINKLAEDGYTIDDIKKVIDIKTQQWKGTDMEKFLRPKTLFAIENFSGYLNEEEKKPFVYDIDAQIKAIKEARELDRQSKQNSN